MKNILIIEDDRKIALALTLRIKFAGYEATTAFDGLTGLDAAVKNPPDLVLLDISLPVGNGFTLFGGIFREAIRGGRASRRDSERPQPSRPWITGSKT
jgi:DNA-binding response OmpR family regulator